MTTVGVDIGGTWVKMGLLTGRRILHPQAIPTASIGKSPARMRRGLVEAIQGLLKRSKTEVAGVGVGIPGLVSYPHGIVHSCANLPGWRDVPLQRWLSSSLNLPVRVDNDVNLMTLAEWKVGAGRGVENLVCLTLGTGVGGGLVLGGRLLRGGRGWAGEIGHIPLSDSGPRCACGGRGCLERTVGNKEILAWVRRQLKSGKRSRIRSLIGNDLKRLSPEVIDQACALQDPLALATWRRVGRSLGIVLVGVVNLLDPQRIVVGGGIAKAGRWLFEPLKAELRQGGIRGPRGVQVMPARLGSLAGLIGAALLAREE